MADCECLNGCPFFNDKMSDAQGLGAMFKKQYCLGDSSKCARFMIFQKLGRAHVPGDLYPNMVDRARELLAGR